MYSCQIMNSGWQRYLAASVLTVLLAVLQPLHSQSLSGTTGLFHVPTAEIMDDKTVISGFNHLPKAYSHYGNYQYNNLVGFATVTFLPRLELMFRYTYRLGAGVRRSDTNFFMDRMVAARFLLVRESGRIPAILFGLHDPGKNVSLAANNTFSASYLAVSKHVEFLFLKTGLHAGYAFDFFKQQTRTHRGFFGGLSVSHHRLTDLQFILEYDSFHWNTAVKLLLFSRIQLMAGLINMDAPATGISYRVQL